MNLPDPINRLIPLWTEHMKNEPFEVVLEHARKRKDIFNDKGTIIFGGASRAEAYQTLNELAEAIAACSFAPGGITIFDQHYKAIHPEHDHREAP